MTDAATPYYSNGFPENTLKGLESGTIREEQFCANIKTGWVAYCFNEAVTLTNLNIWNYNAAGYLEYGMSNIQIEVSSDWGQTYSLVTNLQTMTTVFPLPKGTGATNNPFSSIPLQHLATHLRIRALTTHSTANYSGLSTVRFYGVKPNAIARVTNITVSAYSSFTSGRPPSNTVDGTPYIGDYNYAWLSMSGDTNAWIVFNLGGAKTLSHLVIWNYAQSTTLNNRGMKDIQISGSSNGVAFAPLTIPTHGETTIKIAPGYAAGNPGEVVRLEGQAAYLKIYCVSNYGGTHSGLSEVYVFAHAPSSAQARGTLILVR